MWQLMAAGALMGAMNAKRKADQQEAFNKGQAEMHRYSSITGQGGQMDNSYSPTMLEGGFAGGVQGAAMGQAVGGAFGGPAAPTTNVAAPQMEYAGANALGGQELAQKMGQGMQFQQPGAESPYMQMAALQKPTFFGP